ncbi:MAG: hypothetical protein EBS30_18060 [Planctomycetes bacterium]|nr:hypothetical protein [Planctomycetota bacterium]
MVRLIGLHLRILYLLSFLLFLLLNLQMLICFLLFLLLILFYCFHIPQYKYFERYPKLYCSVQ